MAGPPGKPRPVQVGRGRLEHLGFAVVQVGGEIRLAVDDGDVDRTAIFRVRPLRRCLGGPGSEARAIEVRGGRVEGLRLVIMREGRVVELVAVGIDAEAGGLFAAGTVGSRLAGPAGKSSSI